MGNHGKTHVAVGVISKKNVHGEQEYLLVTSQRDFGKFTGYWYPPGGKIEKGETESAAVIREIREELGVDVNPMKKIAKTAGDLSQSTVHWWRCELKNDDMKINTKEISEAKYFTQAQMGSIRLWPATKTFFDRHIFNNNNQ